MHRIFILLTTLSLLLPLFGQANPYRGYLITKNGRHLTGFIGNVSNEGQQSRVIFINDFGNIYLIEAELIRGFVYRDDQSLVTYESVRDRRNWKFLKMIYSGEEARLYQAPPPRPSVNPVVIRSGLAVSTGGNNSRAYYLQLEGRPIKRITPFGFRRRFRKLLRERAPEIARKIGKKGYRFRNLEEIVKELDAFLKITRHET